MRRVSMLPLFISVHQKVGITTGIFLIAVTKVRRFKIMTKKKSHSENPSGIQYAILKNILVKRR